MNYDILLHSASDVGVLAHDLPRFAPNNPTRVENVEIDKLSMERCQRKSCQFQSNFAASTQLKSLNATFKRRDTYATFKRSIQRNIFIVVNRFEYAMSCASHLVKQQLSALLST